MVSWLRSILLLTVALSLFPQHSNHAADTAKDLTFDSNGTKIRYFLQGEGEPVVLIHGWISSAEINWGLPGIYAELAKNYQVVALDVRGHGKSDKPTREESYGLELVADVIRLMDHLHIKKAHLVGYSMGGIIAAHLLVKHPDRVLSGTLAGMGWLKEGGAGQWGFGRIGKNDPNATAVAVCGRSLAKLALTEDQIKSVKHPVTIIVGEKDRLVQALYITPLRKVRPDWTITEIPDANHLSCIVSQKFKEAIVDWLAKNQQQDRKSRGADRS